MDSLRRSVFSARRLDHSFLTLPDLRGGLFRKLYAQYSVAGARSTTNAPVSRPEATNDKKQSTLDYCIASVKKSDYENYLCTLLLPPSIRSAAFAIRAFNAELAQIRDIISDQRIGQMRLQFWKDTLERIYTDNPPQTPVALQLHRATKKASLSKECFRDLIAARGDSLPDKPFRSVQAVETYGEKAVTPVFLLLLEMLGARNAELEQAAQHLGKGIGIKTLLRSVPYNLQRGVVLIPVDQLIKHRLSADVVSRIGRNVDVSHGIPVTDEKRQALKDLTALLVNTADNHISSSLDLIRTGCADVPKAKTVFLPLVSCRNFLVKLKQNNFDVFHPGLRQRDGWLPAKLWWHANVKF